MGALGGAIAIGGGGGHHPPVVECLVPDLVGKITTVVDTDPLGGMGAGYEQSPGYPGHPQVHTCRERERGDNGLFIIQVPKVL